MSARTKRSMRNLTQDDHWDVSARVLLEGMLVHALSTPPDGQHPRITSPALRGIAAALTGRGPIVGGAEVTCSQRAVQMVRDKLQQQDRS